MKKKDLHTWVENFYSEIDNPEDIKTIDDVISYTIDTLLDMDSEVVVMGKGFDYLRPELEEDLRAFLRFLDHIYVRYDNVYLNFTGVI